MRLFTNRERPYAWGPYPLERLPRLDGTGAPNSLPNSLPGSAAPVPRSGPEPDGCAAAPGTLADSIAPYLALYGELRDGPVADPPVGVTLEPGALAESIKGGCYFLDAAMVGICAIPAEAWAAPPEEREPGLAAHTQAVVMLVAEGPHAAPGGPGAPWLDGAQRARGVLRGGEIACTLAGYLRLLGIPARAHFAGAQDLRTEPLVVAAGLGRWNQTGTALVNPFLGTDYHAAVVTLAAPLALQLPVDLPLAPVQNDRGLRFGGWRHALGWWGTTPGWQRLAGTHRPAHLGRYPQERLKRRERPTTHISDQVPRVPIRGSFFNRAVFGDLGERARLERQRFALKHPFAAAMGPVFMAMVPHQDGAPAPAPAADTADPRADPQANAQAIKAACHFLGADVVGICRVPDYAWYSHDEHGRPVTPDHTYAIVILIDQGYETMEGASGDDWISGAQSMRAYLRGAEICGVLAQHIRGRGHAARSHTNRLSDVLHIPLILLAGLGELSRIGELVLNPFVGPRFKSAVVTTNLPLAVDQPVDFGLQDFCATCRKCARECPCNAIALGPKTLFNGYEIWKPDAEKCARYRLTNLKGSACGRCMKTCPYNTEGLLTHRVGLWIATRLPFTRRWLARLDDWLGNGRRNPLKRWWLDLETVDGRVVAPRGVNERDLRADLPMPPEQQKIAHYPADLLPPADAQEAWPVDRAEGLRRAQAAVAPPRG